MAVSFHAAGAIILLTLQFSAALKLAQNSLKISPGLPKHYHSSEQITAALKELEKSCKAMKYEEKSSEYGNVTLEVITIKKPDADPFVKNFFLFGEHARELISAESALHFIQTLCQAPEKLSDKVSQVLQDNEFKIVVNANPRSRRQVENGEFCLRVNENGIDTNRNWDEAWDPSDSEGPDTSPGNQPFSEPESRIVRDEVSAYKPHHFLTIHSGTKGMYMPFAYSDDMAVRNQANMLKVLKAIDKKHCQCPYGAAGKEVGYHCPGTCLDWVFDKLDTPYAFAFEIYGPPDQEKELKTRWEEKERLAEQGVSFSKVLSTSLANGDFKDIFAKYPSDFVHLKNKALDPQQFHECFAQFNPHKKERFEITVSTWSEAYLDMVTMIADDLRA